MVTDPSPLLAMSGAGRADAGILLAQSTRCTAAALFTLRTITQMQLPAAILVRFWWNHSAALC